MFKYIGLMDYKTKEYLTKGHPDIDWLIDQEIVFDPNPEFLSTNNLRNALGCINTGSIEDKLYEALHNMIKPLRERTRELLNSARQTGSKRIIIETSAADMDSMFAMNDIFLRLMSIYYQKSYGIDTYPILEFAISDSIPEIAAYAPSIEDTIQIVINRLPVPDDSVPWEQIIDFRNDPDTENKLLGLRVWMSDITRAKLTSIEIEQKLEWLLHEYQQHMRLHRMKTNASTLETIIVTGAEIVENLVKLQFGKLAKGLFSLRHRKLALLEGELKSPGREIAFISKAQETFQQ